MTETTTSSDAAGQQRTAAVFFGSVLNSGADPLLKAQADLLESVETTVTGWLRRRHEAVLTTQELVARLRTTSDPSEIVTIQQEWVTGAFRRLTDDVTACQTAAQQLVDRARTWFPAVAEIGQNGASQAAEGSRPAGKSLRVANPAE